MQCLISEGHERYSIIASIAIVIHWFENLYYTHHFVRTVETEDLCITLLTK